MKYAKVFLLLLILFMSGCTDDKKIELLEKEITEVTFIDTSELNGFELLKLKSRYTDALNKYNEIISIDKNKANILEYDLKIINKNLSRMNLFDKYKDTVEIRNISVNETTKEDLGVFGEIRNNSDKTFKTVEIIIYFLDKSDNIIFEKSFTPVLVFENSLNNSTPLKPNYVQKFGYTAEDAPSEWAKKVKIIVSNLDE